MIVYEAQTTKGNSEHQVECHARAKVEAVGNGRVITWSVDHNLPGCKPDYVYRSCSMSVCRDGKWYTCAIHSHHYEEWPEVSHD